MVASLRSWPRRLEPIQSYPLILLGNPGVVHRQPLDMAQVLGACGLLSRIAGFRSGLSAVRPCDWTGPGRQGIPFSRPTVPAPPTPPDARRGGPNARLSLGNPRFQRCWGRLCLRPSMKSATCSPPGMRGHKSKITNASRSSRSGCGRRTNTPSTYLGSIPVLAGFRLYLTVDVHVFAQYIGGEAKENHGVIKRQFQCPEIHRLVAW